MITHAATLDVSENLLRMVTYVISRARRGPGRLPRTRAATARAQALLVIRYLRDAPPLWRLARDTGVSTSTAYRYLHEGLAALAEQAPTLTEAVTAAIDEDDVHLLCLDGTLVPTDRVDARKPDGRHLFYSGADRSSTASSGSTCRSSPPSTGTRSGSHPDRRGRCTTPAPPVST